MALEIEHKYLIRKDLWYAVHKPEGINIRQGYLLSDPGKTILFVSQEEMHFLRLKEQHIMPPGPNMSIQFQQTMPKTFCNYVHSPLLKNSGTG